MIPDSLRRAVKHTALSGLRRAGVYQLAANSARRKSRLLILCYHGLSLRDEHNWHPHLYLTPECFRERLACLGAMNASVLPLDEALVRLETGTLPDRSVAITFDDGFFDFFHHGVPALAEFGFPATLYLTTYYCGLPFPIVNLVLNYLLWKSDVATVSFPQFGIAEQTIRTYAQRTALVMRLLTAFESRGLSTLDKNEVARELAADFGIDYDDLTNSRMFQIMKPEEVGFCAASGVDIQLHTHRHRTPLDRKLFLREIEQNRSRIHEITGTHPVHFCYPSGVHGTEFLPWLRDCNVKSATTCERGMAARTTDPLLLPRVLDDSTMDLLQFEAFVAGVFR